MKIVEGEIRNIVFEEIDLKIHKQTIQKCGTINKNISNVVYNEVFREIYVKLFLSITTKLYETNKR